VLFDFDGVLVDTPTYYFTHIKAYMEKINANVSDEDISNLLGLTFTKKLEFINAKYSLKIEREPFVSLVSNPMMAEMEKSLILDEHLDVLLKDLKMHNITMAIASNNSLSNIEFFLSRLKISHYFSKIISYADVKEHKPAPDTYLKAINLLGTNPQNCVAIEDTVVGVESAKAAGLKCVAIPNKFASSHNFSRADLVIKTFLGLDVKKLEALVK